ncbi:MAG: glycosyltransferase family 4 protein [Terracidiphilus sp.]
MKVALVIGRCPPGTCGTGDYAALLSDALRARGVDARLIVSEDWRVRGVWKVRESLRAYDVVHIVYPTLGFGYNLGPQVLSLLQGCVISIQEASQRRILRKLSLLPFLVRPKHVIFNSEFERQYVTRWAPWTAARSSLIPAPANIRAFPEKRPRFANEVVHFGLIVPHKGLEDVIELSRLIRSEGLTWKVRIIGGLAPERMEYFQKLKAETAALPVIWDVNRCEEEVAERLASSAVAYFPFPDGASERRSSFKAALANGVAVVTTSGAHTTEAMKTFQKFAETPREALGAIHSLLQNPPERDRLARNAADFLLTWERSAELHAAIYRRLLCSGQRPAIDVKDAQRE